MRNQKKSNLQNALEAMNITLKKKQLPLKQAPVILIFVFFIFINIVSNIHGDSSFDDSPVRHQGQVSSSLSSDDINISRGYETNPVSTSLHPAQVPVVVQSVRQIHFREDLEKQVLKTWGLRLSKFCRP